MWWVGMGGGGGSRAMDFFFFDGLHKIQASGFNQFFFLQVLDLGRGKKKIRLASSLQEKKNEWPRSFFDF